MKAEDVIKTLNQAKFIIERFIGIPPIGARLTQEEIKVILDYLPKEKIPKNVSGIKSINGMKIEVIESKINIYDRASESISNILQKESSHSLKCPDDLVV